MTPSIVFAVFRMASLYAISTCLAGLSRATALCLPGLVLGTNLAGQQAENGDMPGLWRNMMPWKLCGADPKCWPQPLLLFCLGLRPWYASWVDQWMWLNFLGRSFHL